MTDCPDREKGPYTGDAEQDIATELNNFDMRAFMRAEVRNFAEAQHANGMVPAEGPDFNNGDDGPNWGGAIIVVPWALFQTYGDLRTLATYYPNMQRYIAFLGTQAKDRLLPDSYGLGDWVSPDPTTTPIGYVNSWGYYREVRELADIAAVLGRRADRARYERLARSIAAAFNAKYLNARAHTYSVGTQAADALALDAGLVPRSQRAAVLRHLLATIASAHGLIEVGSVALAPVIRVLHDAGRDDVLYRWATSTAFPSYGYVVGLGNTTMTEYWDGTTGSLDHHFLGGIDAWFTYGLAGIGQAPGGVAYAKPVIRPAVVGNLTHVDADYQSPFGTLADNWTRTRAGYSMTVRIPSATPGMVAVPLLGSARRITEDGRVVWSRARAYHGRKGRRQGAYVYFHGVSGAHTFAWRP